MCPILTLDGSRLLFGDTMIREGRKTVRVTIPANAARMLEMQSLLGEGIGGVAGITEALVSNTRTAVESWMGEGCFGPDSDEKMEARLRGDTHGVWLDRARREQAENEALDGVEAVEVELTPSLAVLLDVQARLELGMAGLVGIREMIVRNTQYVLAGCMSFSAVGLESEKAALSWLRGGPDPAPCKSNPESPLIMTESEGHDYSDDMMDVINRLHRSGVNVLESLRRLESVSVAKAS